MLEAWSVDESAEGLAVVEVGAVADGAPASYDHNKVYIYIYTSSVGVGYRPTFTTTTRTRPSMGDVRSGFDRGTVGRWWWPSFRSGYRRGRKTDVFVQA